VRDRLTRLAARSAARVRDRGFTPTLRLDPSAPAVVLSPHLDDAVIDCWSVLPSASVVTVFAGVPSRPGVLVHWDAVVGARDSASLMRARREEDRAALSLAGVSPIHLDLLPDPYRRSSEHPTLSAIDTVVSSAVPAASKVYAPAVLGVIHPDHELVRSYALALARAGVAVELYADQPYAVQYGWPSWVTGAEPDAYLDVDAHWNATPGRHPDVNRANARVVALDDGARERKLEAMRAYATQFAMLDRGPIGQLSNPAVHGYEVFWRVAA
jgi:LmbE family N-acetylglucosaminyl deacetylase